MIRTCVSLEAVFSRMAFHLKLLQPKELPAVAVDINKGVGEDTKGEEEGDGGAVVGGGEGKGEDEGVVKKPPTSKGARKAGTLVGTKKDIMAGIRGDSTAGDIREGTRMVYIREESKVGTITWRVMVIKAMLKLELVAARTAIRAMASGNRVGG